MEQAEQVLEIKRLMLHLDRGTTVNAGGLVRNPTSVYTDSDFAACERSEIFLRYPQLVAAAGELPGPGSFLTIDDLGPPVLAVRDAEGRFRAFVNTCRHRGAVVETRARGTSPRFACRFHGWTYDAGGALVNLPKREQFGEVETDRLGLVELPAAERHGLLWVHPDPDGELDVDVLLGEDLAAELASWDFGSLVYLDDDRWDVACNWKLAMDSFGEAYHFESVHPNTVSPAFHGHVHGYRQFGLHHRMLVCSRDIDRMRHIPEDEWEITTAARVGYWLFPNVQLMPFAEGAYLLRAVPDHDDPGRHVTRITYLARPEADVNGDVLSILVPQFTKSVRDEDFAMSVSQQRSYSAGAIPEIVFGRNEPALHHFHAMYRSALGLEPLKLCDSLD